MRVRKNIMMVMMFAILFCAGVAAEPEMVLAEGGEQPVYHAAMGIQTATQIWIQRWGYFDGSQNEYYGTDNYDKLYDSQKNFYEGSFEDVEIKGNGTYTVSLKNADFAGETTISQLQIATDIPVEDSQNLQFKDIKLEINGTEIVTFDEAIMEDEDNYLQGGAVILLFNHWRDKLIEILGSKGRSEDSANGWDLLQGAGSDNISITFTISGLPYDQEKTSENTKEDEESVLTASQDVSGQSKKSEKGSIEDGALSMKQIIGVVVLSILMIIIVIRVIIIKRKDHVS